MAKGIRMGGKGKILLLILRGTLILVLVGNAFTQCPVLIRDAFVDLNRESFVIRYYNSGARPVEAAEFTLIKPAIGQTGPTVIGHYTVSKTLAPRSERRAVFHREQEEFASGPPAILGDASELVVTRVAFRNHSTWKPMRSEACKVAVSTR